MSSRIIARLFTTRYSTKSKHSSRKRASKLNIPRNTGSSSGLLPYNTIAELKVHYIYLLHEARQERTKQEITSTKHLLKVNFCFILPLALCAIIDLHVELRRTAMVVKKHEEPLMQLMVLCKLGPSAPEVHLALLVVRC
jgi:hypothetical protein